MIIWKGFGILVPIIAIFGSMAGTVAGSLVGHSGMGMGLGLGLAAIANWFVWKAFNARPGKVLVDPQTGQQVMLKSSHSLFFIPAGFWSIPMALLAMVLVVSSFGEKEKHEREVATPGYKEFEKAHSLIASNSKGVTHGNTPAAKTAAEGFSNNMKGLVKMAFEGGSKKNLMTGGEFLTYCQEGKDTIAILCHVPSLRSYKSKETKDALAELAWIAGVTEAGKLDPEHKKSLMVGLRGITSFGSIQKGATTEGAKPKALDTSKREAFYAAFAPAAATVTPTAPTASSSAAPANPES